MTSTKTKLTPKRAEFVRHYLLDLNATKAAKRAGYSARTAQRTGSELLCFPLVAAAIETAKADRSERTGIAADRVLQELAAIAFADAPSSAWVSSRTMRRRCEKDASITDRALAVAIVQVP